MSDVTDAALAEAAAWQPAAPPPGAALEAALGDLAPVAPRAPRRELAILTAVSAVYALGLVVALDLRADLGELPVPWLVAVAAAWLLGFLVPCYLALVPRTGSVLPRWRIAAGVTAVAAVAFVVLGLAVHPVGASSYEYGWERLPHGHFCLELGLLTALVPVVLGALYLRAALPVGSRAVAAALGAGGGCLGGLVLHLHCRVADGLHTGLVHGGVVLVSALLAAAIVPRATALR